jgi:hypothetical protein
MEPSGRRRTLNLPLPVAHRGTVICSICDWQDFNRALSSLMVRWVLNHSSLGNSLPAPSLCFYQIPQGESAHSEADILAAVKFPSLTRL